MNIAIYHFQGQNIMQRTWYKISDNFHTQETILKKGNVIILLPY